jgi:predicted RNA-binding Zn ribbon-like protein
MSRQATDAKLRPCGARVAKRSDGGVAVPDQIALFPPDWVQSGDRRVATDLDLVVLLVNSYDLLDDPPDRLHDLRWFSGALRAVGHGTLADALTKSDLRALRLLRDRLREVFEAADMTAVAEVLNPLLPRSRAVPLLVPDGTGGASLAVAPDRTGISALQARLPAALAAFVAASGAQRLGTCAGDPCTCAFVDRTRAGTRRYCCSICNDRTAARSYRARQRTAPARRRRE